MGSLAADDRRRIEDLAECLRTCRDGDGPALRALLPELRSLLDSELGAAYGLLHAGGELSFDFLFTTGMSIPRLGPEFEVRIRESARSPLSYDPIRPEPRQRNVVRVLSPGDLRPAARDFYARHGVGDHHQLRVLLCEGPSLLAWVGGFRRDPFGPRERRVLEALAPALQRRVLLERRLAVAPVAMQLLATALEEIGTAAFLLRRQTVVLANSAGRLLLDRQRAATLEELRDHLAGRRRGGFSLTRHTGPGSPDHILAVAQAAPCDPAPRASALKARWGLTARQAEVLALVARGWSNKAIAGELHCAEGTVEFHVTALLARAQRASRAELVAAFWQQA